MSNYNLLQYSSIISNTAPGTGNLEITAQQATTLYDTITPSTVAISFSDTLCLDIDLGSRIKLDSVSLHISTAEAPQYVISDKLNVYYKNNVDDTYTLGTIEYTDKFEVVDYTEPFAPRYIRVVLGGLVCTLDEIVIYNDDTYVDFGSDGNTSSVYLDNAYDYITLPVFNNAPIGSKSANAYVSVDYSTNYDYNEYIKLSTSFNGTYKSIDDKLILVEGSNFISGKFSGTEIDSSTGYVTTINNYIEGFDDSSGAIKYLGTNQFLTNNNKTLSSPPNLGHWTSVSSRIKIPIWSGNWYWEFEATDVGNGVGDGFVLYGLTLSKTRALATNISDYVHGSGIVFAGDVVSIAFNSSTGKMWYAVNGSWSGNPAAGTGEIANGIVTDAINANDRFVRPALSHYYGSVEVTLKMSEDDVTTGFIPEGFQPAMNIAKVNKTYTSTVVSLESTSLSNHVKFNYSTPSGTYFSSDNSVSGGQVEVRSSNTKPEIYQDLYFSYYSTYTYVSRDRTNDYNRSTTRLNTNYAYIPTSILCNNKYSYVYMFARYSSGSHHVYIYDISNVNAPRYITGSAVNSNLHFNYDVQCTGAGTIWGYNSTHGTLSHYSASLGLHYTLPWGSHFVSGIAASLVGDSCWYVNRVTKALLHIDKYGNVIANVQLVDPKDVATTSSNNCWANDGKIVTEYSDTGEVLQSVTMPAEVFIMCHDLSDGFWCVCRDSVLYNVDSLGNIVSSNVVSYSSKDLQFVEGHYGYYNQYIRTMILRPTPDRVYVFNLYSNKTIAFAKSNGNLLATYNHPSLYNNNRYWTPIPDVYYVSEENVTSIEYNKIWDTYYGNSTPLFPAASDHVWGTNGSATWRTISRDSNFINNDNHYQFRTKFTTDSGIREKPSLKSIYVPPAVKLQDIAPQSSKNVYIKTNLPDKLYTFDYDIKLKTWWGV